MGRNPKHLLPQIRLHAGSGHARVRINGTEHWLGRFGSPEALAAYDRLIAQYLATRGAGPTPVAEGPPPLAIHSEPAPVAVEQDSTPPDPSSSATQPATAVPAEITVAEMCLMYLEYAKVHYVLADGRISSSYHGMRQAVNALRQFQRVPAASFGPRCLREIMDRMAHQKGRHQKPIPRKSINRIAKRIRGLFKWAVSMEIVPAQTWHALMAVEGIRRGRTAAPELPPVRPVADEIVKKTLPHLPKVVADLVWFIRLAGCRPGEACQLRPADIDTEGKVWKWTVRSHKNSWREQERVVMIGPRAQRILRPYIEALSDRPNAYVFSPRVSERDRNKERRAHRESPLTPSQAARKAKPRKSRARPPRERYTDDTLNRCIRRACEKAELPRWTPMQLRHTAGTEARLAGGGLDAAQVRLGHKHANITEVYAELAQEKAAELALKLG
jgi:integrase